MNGYTRYVAHYTVLALDVEGFGDHRRTIPHQLAVREGMYSMLRQAFMVAGIPWTECYHEDRGDGLILLAPAQIPKMPFVESLPYALVAGLRQHNSTHPPEAHIRLRMALHAGEVAFDHYGVTASSINLAFRLVNATPLRVALADSRGMLALITSEWFFDEVVRHSLVTDPSEFRPVRVTEKETSAVGWIARPDYPFSTDGKHLVTLPPSGRHWKPK